MAHILNDLNPSQQEAVKHQEGPLLVLAGAGSGKTRALTYRAAYLIQERGISPENILLLTFTNKAAGEMKERIRKLLITNNKLLITNLPFAGTFHSFCARLLRQEGKAIGLSANYLIYDETDQRETIKRALEKLDIPQKDFNPRSVLNAISQVKNELIPALEYPQYAKGPYQTTIARIYLTYQRFLKDAQALDFDDLLMETVRLLKKEDVVLKKYQHRYQYILVDEWQDTNHAQYVLTKLLAKKWRNLNVVGDASQCLPPETLIGTPRGFKKIKNLVENDQVIAASGRGKTNIFKIRKISRRFFRGQLVYITTKGGKTLRSTPNHILFAALRPTEKTYWVYLMYRRDKGYRIGIAKGQRAGDKRRGSKPSIGLSTRGNQEAADKMWIIKTCSDKQEATFWELYYSCKYGIPTLVFDTCGRNMQITQRQINNLFSSVNTTRRAKKLMEDLNLNPNFPHHRPKGISGKKQPDRQIVHLKFFEDPRQSQKSPWSAHRVTLNTTDQNLKKQVKKTGFYTRPGRRKTWRTEILRLKYSEADKIAQKLSTSAGKIDISYEAFLEKKRKFFFHPASHIQPEMIVAIEKDGVIKGEVVTKVEWQNYNGFVYDLDIEEVHNYLANSIVVHNSIYGWRGADYRNLIRLQEDFPEIKIINLERNYRSTQTILDAANEVIKHNHSHPILKLWTKNPQGEKISFYQAQSEKDEADFIIRAIQEHLLKSKQKNLNQFAVLYRTNAQSRVIEEQLLHTGIPYTLVGGVRFYDRKETKDVLAYLRLLINPQDKVSHQRVEKLGKRRFKKFIELAKKLKGEEIEKLTTSEIMDETFETTGYLELYDPEREEDLMRLENIKELKSVAAEFPQLIDFLENVALVQQEYLPAGVGLSKEKKNNAVTLMTAHAAKGLEFPFVFMVGMEEGLFPHSRSLLDQSEIEEERRLCYVGMTRAKQKLFLSSATRRLYFGQRSINMVSRFLSEIPLHLFESSPSLPNFATIGDNDYP